MNVHISRQIDDIQATIDDAMNRRKSILDAAAGQSRSLNDSEQVEFDDLSRTIRRLQGDLERCKEVAAQMATARPVDDSHSRNATVRSDGRIGNNFAQAKDTQSHANGLGFARVARCLAVSHLKHQDPMSVAKAMYPGDDRVVQGLIKAAVPAASTTNATWAGNLINDGGAAFADFVEFLAARSLFGQVSNRFRRLPFDAPVLVQGSGGTAQWVKEGDAKPLTQWSYTRAKLTPLKVAAVAVATKETLMRASVDADTFLRDELARAVGRRIDGTLVSDDAAVADESPAGLLNGTSALTLTGDGTIQGIRCDITQFLKALVGDSLTVSGAFWVMPETVAIDLSVAVNELGNPAFPGITPTGGKLAGLPVFTSEYVPTGSDGPVVALIKGDEIFIGDEGGIQVSISDQATLQMDNAPTQSSVTPTATSGVSMFQTNSVAFLVERFVNWQKRNSGAVVWANVNWDACGS